MNFVSHSLFVFIRFTILPCHQTQQIGSPPATNRPKFALLLQPPGADDDEEAGRGAHQAADERVHGVVPWPTAEDGPGQPKDAQLGNLEESGRPVEAADRGRKEAVHRRGEAVEVRKFLREGWFYRR